MSTKLTGYVWDACAASGMKLSSVAIMARLADFSSDEGLAGLPSLPSRARLVLVRAPFAQPYLSWRKTGG
jgi:hypothetical protein